MLWECLSSAAAIWAESPGAEDGAGGGWGLGLWVGGGAWGHIVLGYWEDG